MGAGASTAVEAAVEWLGKHFDAEAARGFSAVFVLELTGAAGGSLTLRLAEGALSIAPGAASRRDVVIRVGAKDFLDVLAGRANGELLHMAGRVQIEGETALVVRLQTLFRRRV
jgi:alkyl sulfatase BDS1-like metallo-beta-lactamase superfamily hydrolase